MRGARIWRMVAAIAVVAATVVAVEAAPASAAPTMTLTPSSFPSGTSVHWEVTDLPEHPTPGGLRVLTICPARYADTPPNVIWFPTRVCSLHGLLGPGPNHSGDVVINDVQTVVDGTSTFTCSELAEGCALAAANIDGLYRPINVAYSRFTITDAAWTVSASPTEVDAQGTTTLTMSGFPAGAGRIGLCPPGATGPDYDQTCQVLQTHPGGLPASADVTLPYVVDTPAGVRSECDSECRVVAWVDDGVGPGQDAADSAAVTVNPPTVSLSKWREFTDGDAVTVTGVGFPPGPITVVQCGGFSAPSLFDFADCADLGPGTVAADGTVTATVSVDLPGPGCTRDCWLGIRVGDAASGWGLPAGFVIGSPRIDPFGSSSPFPPTASVRFLVMGWFTEGPAVVQCATPLGPDLASSRCGPIGSDPSDDDLPLVGWAGRTLTISRQLTTTGGEQVDCAVVECVVAAFEVGGPPLASTPVSFVTPPYLSLTPSSGLADGTQMELHAVLDSGSYVVHRCAEVAGSAPRCASTGVSFTIYEPTYDTRIPAVQNFTSTGLYKYQHCRDNCYLAVRKASGGGDVVTARYSMSTPAVSASPATGLTDGATVTVSGTGLQRTYAGPQVIFPTGGWAVAQCSRAVVDDPSLWGVFQHCAIVPGAGPVNVPGTTATTAIQAQASITTILGNTVDCTASPDACVVGMTRWEQDATTSTAFAPISFG